MQSRDEMASAAQVSAVSAIARIAGFARWIALGFAVGTTYLGNIYQATNLVPNVLFALLCGGVLSASLIPALAGHLHRGRDRSAIFGPFNVAMLGAAVVALLGVVLAPSIATLLASNAGDALVQARQVEIGTFFLRVFLPQIPLYVAAAFFQAMLHVSGRFIAAAFAPFLSSVVVIATYLLFAFSGGGDVFDVSNDSLRLLAFGTSLGVVVLCLWQLPSVLAAGFRWKPILAMPDREFALAIRSGLGGSGYVIAVQVTAFIAAIVANRVEGGVVAYQIAYAFADLPNALIGVPVAVAMFPRLAREYVVKALDVFGGVFNKGFALVGFVALPAGVGLYVLSEPIGSVVGGLAPQLSADLLGSAIAGLSFGVGAWALSSTVARAQYARRASASASIAAMVSTAAFAIGAFGFASGLRGGRLLFALGVSASVGVWLEFFVGAMFLTKAKVGVSASAVGRVIVSTAWRSVFMGLVAYLVVGLFSNDAFALVAGALAGLLVYGAISLNAPMGRTLRSQGIGAFRSSPARSSEI